MKEVKRLVRFRHLSRGLAWRGIGSKTGANWSGLDAMSYVKAIEALNGLQTNHSVIEQVKKERRKNVHLNLERAEQMLVRSGMSMDDLDSMKVIHVSGTKGKGSTCAFCESILRRRGLKTGLFTSPHLLSVTERVRVNGRPLEKEVFASYFWKVYNKVVTDHPDQYRPPYFKFLTVLAYHIFWRENVDVAIMEVGIGGRYDCTNVVRKPIVCGITTLDLDHTSILGKTLEEIAWQKAGIMKGGAPTFVDGHQTEGALQVFREEGRKVGSETLKVPDLSAYQWGNFPPKSLGMFGEVHHRNASLALQMCRYFHGKVCSGETEAAGGASDEGDGLLRARPFRLQMEEALGLKLCKWPGRAQLITRELRGQKNALMYFLDGAHTQLSMDACKSWFQTMSRTRCVVGRLARSEVHRVLIFNLTKEDRNAVPLLESLSECDFDKVIFTPNITLRAGSTDNVNHTMSFGWQMERCRQHARMWSSQPNQKVPSRVVESINDALQEVQSSPANAIQVLITGSLLLVGNALQLIEPSVCEPTRPQEEEPISSLYARLNQH